MTRIEVTREDIDGGRPLVCGACPVALAVTRRLRSWASVTATPGFIRLWGTSPLAPMAEFVTPAAARLFIDTFDDSRVRHNAAPFAIDLDIPPHLLRQDAPRA